MLNVLVHNILWPLCRKTDLGRRVKENSDVDFVDNLYNIDIQPISVTK